MGCTHHLIHACAGSWDCAWVASEIEVGNRKWGFEWHKNGKIVLLWITLIILPEAHSALLRENARSVDKIVNFDALKG